MSHISNSAWCCDRNTGSNAGASLRITGIYLPLMHASTMRHCPRGWLTDRRGPTDQRRASRQKLLAGARPGEQWAVLDALLSRRVFSIFEKLQPTSPPLPPAPSEVRGFRIRLDLSHAKPPIRNQPDGRSHLSPMFTGLSWKKTGRKSLRPVHTGSKNNGLRPPEVKNFRATGRCFGTVAGEGFEPSKLSRRIYRPTAARRWPAQPAHRGEVPHAFRTDSR